MTDYKKLKNSILFSGMKEEEIRIVLGCLSKRVKRYEKGSIIFQVGDEISELGIVMGGSVHIIREDYWGNRDLIARIGEYEIFGETYACTPASVIPVYVIAAQKTEVLFLKVKKILTTCSSACQFHNRLIQNMLAVLAEKNLQMTNKIDVVTKTTTRSKLMTYLSKHAEQNHCSEFSIPLTRQQLPDYLGVDRSAMRVELKRMQQEGLVQFGKNQFHLM